MATETKDQETTTAAPTTKPSADSAEKAAPRKLASLVQTRNPDNDAILAEIAGKPVTITAATSENRQGKRRKYWITTVTLDDGRTFTVVGKGVADPLNYLKPEDYPVEATFTQEPSDFEPGAMYWTLE